MMFKTSMLILTDGISYFLGSMSFWQVFETQDYNASKSNNGCQRHFKKIKITSNIIYTKKLIYLTLEERSRKVYKANRKGKAPRTSIKENSQHIK